MNNGETVQGAEDVLFNTAFAVGGPQCTVQTVEKLTGVYIDHFLVLDFNGFKDMVNAVNGVEVCIPEDVRDPAHDIYLEAGTQTLDGQAALEYVRERTVLSPTGDIGRMKRQQAFIASMVKKVMSAGILSQPARVYDFLSAVTSSIKVDAELDSVAKLADLAMQFQDTGLAKIDFITVPIEPYPPDPNRLVWAEEAEQLWERIKLDRPLGRTFSDTSIEADDSVGTATGEPSPEGSESPTEPSSPDEEAQSERAEQRAQAQAEARRAAGLCV